MIIGYARVSTQDQNTGLQEEALRKAGCEVIHIEKASGAREDRPVLAEMLRHARKGDVICVWRLDRLARSIRHLIELAADLRKRGIHLRSLCDQIDTTTASGELHFHMLAALAQFERKLIAERVRAGLEAAWASGSVSGRKPMDHEANAHKLELARTLVRGGKSVSVAARVAGLGRSTLYRYLDREPVSKTLPTKKKGRRNSGTDLGTVSAGKIANMPTL
jgi:DNA invertase Pin-like site-specific DNA recombinase